MPRNLTYLNLNSPFIESIDIGKCFRLFPQLKRLKVRSSNDVQRNSEIIKKIVEAPKDQFPALEILDLSGLTLQDADLEMLANSSNLENLEELSFLASNLTQQGLKFIKKSPHLNKLLKVNLEELPGNCRKETLNGKLQENNIKKLKAVLLSPDPVDPVVVMHAPLESNGKTDTDANTSESEEKK